MKGKFLKCFLVATAVLLFSITGTAQAAMAPQGVPFYAVDDPSDPVKGNDDLIDFGVINYTFPPGTAYTVQFSLNGIDSWNTFANNTLISYSGLTNQPVYLRLDLGDETYDYSGDLVFSGPAGVVNGLNVFNSLTVNWGLNEGVYQLTIATPANGDDVAPVPIPAAAWLLGAGLVAIVGIRRKGVE